MAAAVANMKSVCMILGRALPNTTCAAGSSSYSPVGAYEHSRSVYYSSRNRQNTNCIFSRPGPNQRGGRLVGWPSGSPTRWHRPIKLRRCCCCCCCRCSTKIRVGLITYHRRIDIKILSSSNRAPVIGLVMLVSESGGTASSERALYDRADRFVRQQLNSSSPANANNTLI